ncbi:MAG: hypothetical protein NC209_00860 [Alistipes sp.]|nr:hypothetical protein [Alistipes senegalensis]MCM1249684.1 hypothetical protein [Alistipes sp.]
MKSSKIFILAAVALVAGLFTACSDDDFAAGPAASGAQAYFPQSIASEYSIGDDVNEIVIPVMRIVADEAQTIPVLAEDESGLFSVPAAVTFAAGEEKAELKMTFDRTALEDGVEYPVSLLLNDEDNTTPYGNRSLALKIVPWPWESLGTGMFRDDWLSSMFKGNEVEIEVQIYKHKSRAGIYMIEEMYGWPFLTEFFGGSQADIESQVGLTYTPTNITLNASDPNAVFFPRQFTGITDKDPDYGDYEIATFSSGNGKLETGVITFPASGLAFVCAAGNMAANKNGTFRILLPGAEIVDYSLEVEYESMRMDADGATAAILSFVYGADVTRIDYAVAATNISAEERETLAAAIAAGTAEHVNKIENLDGTGSVSEQVALTDAGPYTVVAVAYDKAGKALAADFVSMNFFFPGAGGGGTAPECDVEALLALPSVLFQPETAAQYPDESNLGYKITGTEVKSIRYYLNTTDIVENGGLEPEAIVDGYGSDMPASAIATINEQGAFGNIFINLNPDTSYTLIVKATNAYGKTKLVTAECSTGAPDYKGELVIGDYKMSYTLPAEDGGDPETFENVFTVKAASSESVVDFLVSDFALEDGGVWNGKYDSAASTLTLTSSDLGKWYLLNETTAYSIGSYAGEGSNGTDPVVLTVDATTKQLKGLQTDIEIALGSVEGGQITDIIGALGIYYADGTTIEPYAGAATSSVKLHRSNKGVKVPFRSVADMQAVVRRNRLTSNVEMADNVGLTVPVRTLAVKTERCERPAKTIERTAGAFMLNENLRLVK